MTNFRSLLNRPIVIPAPPGAEIYEWSYINDDGKTVTEKQNIYQKIQSYERTTDYKEMIDNGINPTDPRAVGSGYYGDVTAISDNAYDVNSYLSRLVQDLQAALSAQQSGAAQKATAQSNQAAIGIDQAQSKQDGGQTK